MYNSMEKFMLNLLKSRKTDNKYKKTPTFLLNVTFITFLFAYGVNRAIVSQISFVICMKENKRQMQT